MSDELLKKFWNILFRKKQLVALSEMERSFFWIKCFHLQYDSFQIDNEINLFGDEIWYFITRKADFIADLKRIIL